VTTSSNGRHRVPARYTSPVLALTQSGGNAGAVAKTGAVLAVSGGLMASLGMQANAAAASPLIDAAPQSSGVKTGVQAASAVPAELVSGFVAAPTYGHLGFTAKVAPKPKPRPVPVVEVRRQTSGATGTTDRVSRSGERAPVEQTKAATPTTVKAGAPGSAEFGATIMAIAARYAGTPYLFGGTTPSGFDCSGFTGYVFSQAGVSLPRTSSAQRGAATTISRSEAVPGDLVFMPGHVGIYAGNGMMWDSPHTGAFVSKRAVYSSSATYGRVG
jgi:peptidoglycan DL-endopeptidase CwlO